MTVSTGASYSPVVTGEPGYPVAFMRALMMSAVAGEMVVSADCSRSLRSALAKKNVRLRTTGPPTLPPYCTCDIGNVVPDSALAALKR